jgi:hypothetical protein
MRAARVDAEQPQVARPQAVAPGGTVGCVAGAQRRDGVALLRRLRRLALTALGPSTLRVSATSLAALARFVPAEPSRGRFGCGSAAPSLTLASGIPGRTRGSRRRLQHTARTTVSGNARGGTSRPGSTRSGGRRPQRRGRCERDAVASLSAGNEADGAAGRNRLRSSDLRLLGGETRGARQRRDRVDDAGAARSRRSRDRGPLSRSTRG